MGISATRPGPVRPGPQARRRDRGALRAEATRSRRGRRASKAVCTVRRFPPLLDESPPLEIRPGTGGDAEWSDRAESEGLERLFSYSRLARPELLLDLGRETGEPCESSGDVGLLHQQVDNSGGSPQLGRTMNGVQAGMPSAFCAALTAATTWYSDSFSPVKLEKWAPLAQELQHRCPPFEADATDEVVHHVSVEPARRRGDDEVAAAFDQLGPLDDLGVVAVPAWSFGDELASSGVGHVQARRPACRRRSGS